MGTCIGQDNQYLYSFFNADQIFDFLLSIGMKPFVELSFMPSALASGTATTFWWKANITPPKDYGKWAELIRQLQVNLVGAFAVTQAFIPAMRQAGQGLVITLGSVFYYLGTPLFNVSRHIGRRWGALTGAGSGCLGN